jgi:hypothetical protein
MTSVFIEIGRGRPFNFRKRPQALHSTEPNSSRRQRGVRDVPQFWHVGCEEVLVAIMVPVGIVGNGCDREGIGSD